MSELYGSVLLLLWPPTAAANDEVVMSLSANSIAGLEKQSEMLNESGRGRKNAIMVVKNTWCGFEKSEVFRGKKYSYLGV